MVTEPFFRLAVSGTIPEEPVINRNNGQLYERRLVEKFVKVSKLAAMKLLQGSFPLSPLLLFGRPSSPFSLLFGSVIGISGEGHMSFQGGWLVFSGSAAWICWAGLYAGCHVG